MIPEIWHDQTQRRFYCLIDGKECAVEYALRATTTQVMDIYRTFVHTELRGKGIAETLLQSAIAFARQSGLAIRPSCAYAAVYFRRHREHHGLLAADVDLKKGGSCRVV